jgi:hypothetical protein
MKKKILAAAVLLLLLSMPLFAEIEIGLGFSPPLFPDREGLSGDFFEDSIKSAHIGYSFWWLFYASVDAMVLPPYSVQGLTSTFEEGYVQLGHYRPGFLFLLDAGIRPRIGPIFILAEVGINNLYVFEQDKLEASGVEINTDLGVNLKVGAGLKFGFWGVTLSGTAVFANPEIMMKTLQALGSTNQAIAQKALDTIVESLYPAITLQLMF